MHQTCKDFVVRNLQADQIKGRRVLEVGSYNVNGSPRDWLVPLAPAKYLGVDIQSQVGYVDKTCNAADVADRFGDEWDVVISTEMLEHCKDWRAAITGMKQAVKPGGILLITARGPGKAPHDYPSDYWRFTKDNFAAVFADFDTVALEEDTGEPGVLFVGVKSERAEVDLSGVEVMAVAQKGIQGAIKVLLCAPMRVIPNGHGGTRVEPVSVEWHRAMSQLGMPFGWNVGEVRVDGYEVGEARCIAVEEARRRGGEFIMFIDNDTLLPSFAFRQLLYRATATHPDFDVFAGVYCDKGVPASPIIFKDWNAGPYWDWTVGDVIEDVVGVPMGCTLLRLSLFDRLEQTPEKPWFKTLKADDTGMVGTMTEDLFFCKRAVEEAGCKILVDTKIICGHLNNSTGAIYTLPEDCPPIVRAGIKLDE